MPNTPTQKPYTDSQEPIFIDTKEGSALALQMLSDAMAAHDLDDIGVVIDRLETLIRKRRSAMEKNVPEIYHTYMQKLAAAKWHVLNRLTPDDVALLFRNHFEHFFEHDFDEVLSHLRTILQTQPSREERDRVKQQWRDAIAESQARIGQTQIVVTGSRVNPTLHNWLNDWRDFLHGRDPSPLLIVEYLNSSEDIRAVPQAAREQVERVLKFINHLRKSSQTPEGMEDRVMVPDPFTGTYKTFNQGHLEESHVPVPKEILKEVREEAMLDEHGNPLPLVERVKRSALYESVLEEIEQQKPAEPAQAPAPTPQPPAPTPQAPMSKPAVGSVQRAKPGLPTIIPLPEAVTPPPHPSVLPPRPTVPPVAPSSQPNPQDLAKRVLGEYKILFPSADLEKRFLSVLVSYFSGVRDRTEAHEALTRVSEEGGVNLSSSQSDDVLTTADHIRDRKDFLPHPVVPQHTAPSMKPRLEDVVAIAEQKKQHAPQPVEEVEDILANVNIFDAPTPQPEIPPAPRPMAPGRPTKPMVQDIAHPHAPGARTVAPVMGPIDELKAVNLEEFHRLSTDPHAAAQHVFEKVQLLESESIEKKAEGIRAWQSSPLNQLYIAIGNQSLERGVGVEEVIAERQQRQEPTLTPEEFAAVADVNRQLRF